ncbi:hypothetical protein B0H10DRAFT_2231600 [Mycena sp. CBHHK59/15]|nr:hypothetical protein B0H10DRAFT_2231600 [Mycena sp. CBHHK59/15]
MKRKVTAIVEDDDLNDGSDSDDSLEDYVSRNRVPRIHHIPDETITVTKDGGLRSTFSTVATPASPAKKSQVVLNPDRAPSPPPQSSIYQDWQTDYSEFDAEYGSGLQQGPREQRDSDNPNEQWAHLDREDFLDEFVRHDGRGTIFINTFAPAQAMSARVPIWYSGAPTAFIPACIVRAASKASINVCHCITSRSGMGYPSNAAPSSLWAFESSWVIRWPHHRRGGAGLLQLRYGKAQADPAVAALRRFDHMALESKCSAYEFYNSLARETDNTGLEPSRERYEEFLRMTRQWQHLKLLKRAGRAHAPEEDRIGTTKAGECALLCPACPQPGKNLPPNWEKVPFEKAFIYALFLALDANFRLKRKDVSSEEKDPGLVRGWAFFGEVTAYMTHLDRYWDQKQERSTCVAHDAVDKPDRESLGTASSGIGTVDCARHNMKRPNGVGDLQKGERYLNMDYLFFMSLASSPLTRLYVSYDIACQWHKNIWERMKVFAEYKGVQFEQGKKYVVFLVPKFHLPAHIELCNILFSFNLTPFVGRTDGEAPERGWADANRLANSTSISGPGARRDTLDVHF